MCDKLYAYFTPPKRLPFFPNAEPAKGMTPMPGGKVRKRWKDKKAKKVYEWDYQHGRVERWDWKGKKHEGEFDPNTGKQIKDGEPSRGPIPMTLNKPLAKRKIQMKAAYYLFWYDKKNGDYVDDKLLTGISESDVMKWFGCNQPEDTYGCLPLETSRNADSIAQSAGVSLSPSKYNYFVEWLEAPQEVAKT